LLPVGDAGGDELVVLVDVDGDDSAGHDVGEVFERGLFDGSVAGGEEDVLAFFFEVADGRMVTTFSPGWRSMSEAMALPFPAEPASGIS